MIRSPKKGSHIESRDWRAPFLPSGLETHTPKRVLSADTDRSSLFPPNPNFAIRKWLTTATSSIYRHLSLPSGSKSKLDLQRGAEPGDLQQREGGRRVYVLLSMVILSNREVTSQDLEMWPVNQWPSQLENNRGQGPEETDLQVFSPSYNMWCDKWVVPSQESTSFLRTGVKNCSLNFFESHLWGLAMKAHTD